MDFTIWSDLLKQLLERQSLSRTQAAELMQGWIKDSGFSDNFTKS
jgi:anthranilate phosphoribosyltransferase